MHLLCTVLAREIALSALALDRQLNLDCGALCRRLGHSEKEAKEALSTNGFMQSAFESIPSDSAEDATIDLPSPAAARRLRIALVIWGAKATKSDAGVHQLTLSTDIDERKTAAQYLVDALSEQLQLPVADISALAKELDKKPAKEKKVKPAVVA